MNLRQNSRAVSDAGQDDIVTPFLVEPLSTRGRVVRLGPAIDAILKRNNDQATAFGFKGTPSFIVGKFRVPGALTMEEFGQVIADARKAGAEKKTNTL